MWGEVDWSGGSVPMADCSCGYRCPVWWPPFSPGTHLYLPPHQIKRLPACPASLIASAMI